MTDEECLVTPRAYLVHRLAGVVNGVARGVRRLAEQPVVARVGQRRPA